LDARTWKEEKQAAIIEASPAYLLTCRDVAGVFIWQFCDARTQIAMWKNRPAASTKKAC
jgi:hypothetical protein